MRKRKGIGSHQSAKMIKDEWLTPPEIIEKLGPFDLDPCAPSGMENGEPWKVANSHYDINENGLKKPWFGRVFCNPPYGLQASEWLYKCSLHGNATALIFARTETQMFFNYVWSKATAILFIKGRLYFHHSDGTRAKANSGAPSVLIAYDQHNANRLKTSKIEGKYIEL